MDFSKRNQLFAGDSYPHLDEKNTGKLQFTKKWNWNELYNIKDTFAESFQLQISVLHQGICIFKAGLSSLSDAWAKYKEKVPEVSASNQNVETTCNSKLRFTELKDLFIKMEQKN